MSKLIPRTGSWKHLASANNETLVPVTLNETDMERLIVKLLERLVRQGRVSRTTADPGNEGIPKLVDDVAQHPKLMGFSSAKGKQVLEGWLRASVFSTNSAGKNRKGGDKIDYFIPHSSAVYRSGYPKQTSRFRKADTFAYLAVQHYLQSQSQNQFQEIFTGDDHENRTVLSRGIEFGIYPRSEPHYLEGAEIDIETLIQLRALETISGPDTAVEKNKSHLGPFPSTYENLGSDLVVFLEACKDLTAIEITSGLQGILGYHFYCLPLITALELDNKLDTDSGVVEPLGLYFDFTSDEQSQSRSIANMCVSRDFERFRRLFDNMILLREVESAILTSEYAKQYKEMNPHQRLDFQVTSILDADIQNIVRIKLSMLFGEMSEEYRTAAEMLIERYENPIVKLARIIIEDREQDALNGMRKWAYSTGGLEPESRQTANYLLVGTKRAPTTWSYKLSDNLLTSLIQMCFIHGRNQLNSEGPKRIPLSHLLATLESRYGILIAKPPVGMQSDEDLNAAHENLKAFKAKLKLLGLFDGLSDDSTAQHVRNPLRSSNEH